MLRDGVNQLGSINVPGSLEVRHSGSLSSVLVFPGAGYIRDKSGLGVYSVVSSGNPVVVPLPAVGGTGDRVLSVWASVRDSFVPDSGSVDAWGFDITPGILPPPAKAGSLRLAELTVSVIDGDVTGIAIKDTRGAFQLNNSSGSGSLLGSMTRFISSGNPAQDFDVVYDFASIFPQATARLVYVEGLGSGGKGGNAAAGSATNESVGGGGGAGAYGLVRVALLPDNPSLRVSGVSGPGGGVAIQRPDWAEPYVFRNGSNGGTYTTTPSDAWGMAPGGRGGNRGSSGATPGLSDISGGVSTHVNNTDDGRGLVFNPTIAPNNLNRAISKGGRGAGALGASGGMSDYKPDFAVGWPGDPLPEKGDGNSAASPGAGGGGAVRTRDRTVSSRGGYGGDGVIRVFVYA